MDAETLLPVFRMLFEVGKRSSVVLVVNVNSAAPYPVGPVGPVGPTGPTDRSVRTRVLVLFKVVVTDAV